MTALSAQPRSLDTPNQAPAPLARWSGRVMTGLALSFLAFDTALKLFALAPAVQATTELGYPAETVAVLGAIELACLVLTLVPRTAVLGALLWTGYLGGAVATHVRAASPLFTHTLFPVWVAILLWGGLWLRDARLRALLPLSTRSSQRKSAP